MPIYEIILTIFLGLFLIYYVVSKLIDRKSNAKLILNLFKLMFDLGLCKIEPKEAQKLYMELYNSSFLTKKDIKNKLSDFIKTKKGI